MPLKGTYMDCQRWIEELKPVKKGPKPGTTNRRIFDDAQEILIAQAITACTSGGFATGRKCARAPAPPSYPTARASRAQQGCHGLPPSLALAHLS